MNIFQIYSLKSREEKKRITSVLTGIINFTWGLVQVGMGIFLPSLFLVFAGLFSIVIGFAKTTCLIGLKKGDDQKKKYVIIAHALIILAGVFYCWYNVRLLFGYKPTDFGLIPSITIALVATTTVTLAIINLVQFWKGNAYYKTICLVSLITALTNVMLTQMSLLMVEMPEMDQRFNVYFALGIGVFAMVTGVLNLVFMLRKFDKEEKENHKEN